MANSEPTEVDIQSLVAKLGGAIIPPDSEFEQLLRHLHVAAVEYARNNNWPPGEAAIHALARTAIFDSRTREEFAAKQGALLLSASDEDPRVKALAVVLLIEWLTQHVETWKSRMRSADDRSVHAIAFSFPHPELKDAEEEIRWLKAQILQENEEAFQAAFHSEILGSRDAKPDAIPAQAAADLASVVKHSPEQPPRHRDATPRDDKAFHKWALSEAAKRRGVGPSRDEMIAWYAHRNIGRAHARKQIKNLPLSIRQKSGKAGRV